VDVAVFILDANPLATVEASMVEACMAGDSAVVVSAARNLALV
jgi:hypothetical protein